MKGATHISAGIAVGVAICSAQSLPILQAIPVTGAAALGALVPDIDIGTSKIGHLVQPASFLIQLLFGHRGLFHYPVLYLIIYGLLMLLAPQYALYINAGILGVASHLFLDTLTERGIPFWPLTKRLRIAKFHSGGIVDYLIQMILNAFTLLLVLEHGFHLTENIARWIFSP